MANQVLVTTFTRVIQENLFRNAAFLKYGVNHDAYVKSKSVEIPQAGDIPDVVIDSGDPVLPLPVAPRSDDKKSYDLFNFRTLPTVIENSEELETSYDKASSVLKNHVDKLNQSIGDRGAIEWSIDPTEFSGRIIRTSGSNSTKALLPTMTGTRKALSIDDLADARAVIGDDDVPEDDGFYCLMPNRVYWDFISQNKDVLDQDFMNKGNLPSGMVAKVHGWYIMGRSETSRYNADATARKALGTANAADDSAGIMCWHKNYTARALGIVKVYSDIDKPEYQGDLYSAMVRFNNVVLRNDGKGIVTIVQAPGS